MSEGKQPLPPTPAEPRPGIYRHFKSPRSLYYVFGPAVSSEDLLTWEVVYYSYTHQKLLRRPLSMFLEKVSGRQDDDGNPYNGPRFLLVRAHPFHLPTPEARDGHLAGANDPG